jgi:hypothetical protein
MSYLQPLTTTFVAAGWKLNETNNNILELNQWNIEIDIFSNSLYPHTDINTTGAAGMYPPVLLEGANWNSQLRKCVAIRQKDQVLYDTLQSISSILPLSNLGIGGNAISAIVLSFDGGYLKFIPDLNQLKTTSGCSGGTSQILIILRKNNNYIVEQVVV